VLNSSCNRGVCDARWRVAAAYLSLARHRALRCCLLLVSAAGAAAIYFHAGARMAGAAGAGGAARSGGGLWRRSLRAGGANIRRAAAATGVPVLRYNTAWAQLWLCLCRCACSLPSLRRHLTISSALLLRCGKR